MTVTVHELKGTISIAMIEERNNDGIASFVLVLAFAVKNRKSIMQGNYFFTVCRSHPGILSFLKPNLCSLVPGIKFLFLFSFLVAPSRLSVRNFQLPEEVVKQSGGKNISHPRVRCAVCEALDVKHCLQVQSPSSSTVTQPELKFLPVRNHFILFPIY